MYLINKFCCHFHEDCIHLPRPNTSNIVYECNDKILEFMYPEWLSKSPSKLNHLLLNCAIVNNFSKCVFFNKLYPCIIALSYFANIQSHAAADISSINPLIFSGVKDFNNIT